jgi:hypothetical protein
MAKIWPDGWPVRLPTKTEGPWRTQIQPVTGFRSTNPYIQVSPAMNDRFCRIANLDWQQGRVYFLAFLNLLRGQPVPALTARLASLSATVDEPATELD